MRFVVVVVKLARRRTRKGCAKGLRFKNAVETRNGLCVEEDSVGETEEGWKAEDARWFWVLWCDGFLFSRFREAEGRRPTYTSDAVAISA